MIRKLIALSVLALSLFGAKAAHAEVLMLGAYDFQPYDISTAYTFLGGRGGYVSSGFTSVKAPLHIPIGKRFANIWCQVSDFSTTQNVTLTLEELQSTDFSSGFGARTVASTSTSGAGGHAKIRMSPAGGDGIVKSFDCTAVGGNCTYFTYFLTASLPGTSNTTIKACTVEYF